jgi:peptidylprolyl isomerase
MPRRSTLLLASFLTVAVAATTAVAVEPTPAPAESAAAEPAGTVTTKSGLKYLETAPGEGATPKPGQTVVVIYTLTVADKEIEGAKGGRNFEFALGKGQALKGLDEGVSTMKVGGKRTLWIPPALGYGPEGVPGKVPPNAMIQIEVELKAIR